MIESIEGKFALVTGAGRGIGKAIARALTERGAQVIMTARSANQLAAAADELRDTGGMAYVLPADLAEPESVRDLFERLHDITDRLDILVNNAGLGLYGPVHEFDIADFDRVIAVNLRGTFLCCQEALKVMRPAGTGYIINIASVVGVKGYANQAAYTASKHGVMGLTKTLAVEAQNEGIRVSAILPGGVDTDMVAQARPDLDRSILIRPEDVAATVVYMLSLSATAHVDQISIRRRNGTPF